MEFILHERQKGNCAELVSYEGLLSETGDFLDIAANSSTRSVIIPKEMVHEDFFDLSTGIAGEILQKCSNYSFRLAFQGDFSEIKSKSLKDFIYESNRGGQILFIKDKEEILQRWLG